MKRFSTQAPITIILLISVAVFAAAQQEQPIENLSAEVREQAVRVRWERVSQTGDLILFRSREPIASTERLAAATQIAVITDDAEDFLDYPIPGVPAYYALVSADAIAEGSITLQLQRNATAGAVEMPLGSRVSDTRFFAPFPYRAGPLPYLQPMRDMLQGDGEALPRALPEQRATRLDPATAAAVDRLMQNLAPERSRARASTVLPDDGRVTHKGVAFTLRTIVDGPFSRGSWTDARTQLENLLTLPLPPQVEARARFYLGQTLYYEGLYERAVLEFLLARSHYHAEASNWIGASLRRADIGVR